MSKPNIIFILTDHFRPDALGSFTPNLMEIAAGGTSFRNMYCAAPLCQPSRVSLITGMYPSQHGVCGNQNDPVSEAIRDDSFMKRLQGAGYVTAMIGKHHFIDRYGIGMDITEDDEEVRRYGFDSVFQVVDDGENCHNDDEYTKYLDSKGQLEQFRSRFGEATAAYRHPFGGPDTADGLIGKNAIEFIREYNGKAPFYLNLSFVGPHPPYWNPGALDIDPADMSAPLCAPDDWQTRKKRAHYTQRCLDIDRYVGDLVTALRERDLFDDTVIIFTSDHGDCLGDFGIWDKRFFYENVCGVPFVIAGPGLPRGVRENGPRVSAALASHVDVYPTLLDIAGIEDTGEHKRSGLSLVPMLRGSSEVLHRAVYAELSTSILIHTGNWKMVFDPEQGGLRFLYNMITDPKETENLAGNPDYVHLTHRLLEQILSHRISLTQHSQVKEEQRLQQVRLGHSG